MRGGHSHIVHFSDAHFSFVEDRLGELTCQRTAICYDEECGTRVIHDPAQELSVRERLALDERYSCANSYFWTIVACIAIAITLVATMVIFRVLKVN